MKINNLVKLLIVTLLLSFSMAVKAEGIQKITVDKLVSTINTGITTNKLYGGSASSSYNVTAKKTTSGLDITFKKDKEELTQSYVYNAADNSLSITVDDISSGMDALAKYMGAVYMQIWLYEASQYSHEEVIAKMLNNPDAAKEEESTTSTTKNCTLAVDAFCADEDVTNKKITMHFLMSDLFAQKINEEFGITTKKDTKEDTTTKTATKNPETGAFANGVALVSISSLALVTIIILKRNNMFYRI